jgi:WD40 repeat protein
MRWLRWGLLAAWVGVHAALWAVLPPLPVRRIPSDMPGAPSFVEFGWPVWSTGGDHWGLNKAAFAEGGRLVVIRDSSSASRYETATGCLDRTWVVADKGQTMGRGLCHDLVVSRDGRRAVMDSHHGDLDLLDLETGVCSKLDCAPLDRTVRFSDDGRFLAHAGGWNLGIKDFQSDRSHDIKLRNKAELLALSPDGRMAAVAVSSNYSGSHHSKEFIGVELIELESGRIIGQCPIRRRARWLFLRFAPDGQTLAGGYTQPVHLGGNRIGESPCIATWSVPSCARRAIAERVWCCGWLSDNRLLIRSEDGECLAADDELRPEGSGPVIPCLDKTDDLMVADTGQHLLVKRLREGNTMLQSVFDRVLNRAFDPSWAEWECFDLDGRSLARVGGWTGPARVSPDGRFLAVGSADDEAVALYRLPTPSSGGLVLPLMAAEVAAFVAWTAWHRRARRPRCAAP